MNRTAWGVLALLGCSACGGSLFESKSPVSTSYVLASVRAPETPGAAIAIRADLSIGRPEFAPGLDTDRIAVLKGRQLDYYRAARWSGRAGEVVQTLLVDSFVDQQLFRSVAAEQARVASDYVLDVTVRDFQAEYQRGSDEPTARVRMIGRIIRVVDRELVSTVTAQADSTAEDNRMSAVAAAFETAAQRVALDLAHKTAEAITSDESNLRTARGENGGD